MDLAVLMNWASFDEFNLGSSRWQNEFISIWKELWADRNKMLSQDRIFGAPFNGRQTLHTCYQKPCQSVSVCISPDTRGFTSFNRWIAIWLTLQTSAMACSCCVIHFGMTSRRAEIWFRPQRSAEQMTLAKHSSDCSITTVLINAKNICGKIENEAELGS